MYSQTARIASLLLASGFSLMITVYPPALAQWGHAGLMLVIWGICAGFVHGIGFDPDSRVWRILLGPWSAWILMGGGLVLIARPYFPA